MRFDLLLPLLALAVVLPARAATFRVGSEPSCTHATIQAAVDAADASPGADTILPTPGTYTAQAIVIDTDEELTIAGGLLSCFSPFYGDQLLDIDGAGGGSASVFRISGGPNSVIHLTQLRIRNGDASPLGGLGGGIHYDGSGTLVVSNAAIINNRAQKGGGIYADGDVESATLVIGANVTISGNTAFGDGGGVFVNGMTLQMREPNSIIAFNHANGELGATGYGGGLVVRSTGSRAARAYVSSGGVGSLGAIYGNDAVRGGGIAVSAGDDSEDDAELFLFTTDAEFPAAVRGNFASESGGALYVWPNRNAFSEGFASANLYRAELTDNAAPEGAAAFVDQSDISGSGPIGGFLRINTSVVEDALPCPAGSTCGLIAGNIAENANGDDTDGAVILLTGDAELTTARGLVFRDNVAGRIVDARGSDEFFEARAELTNTFAFANELRQQLVRGSGNALITIHDSTIADNAIGAAEVLAASRNNVFLRRSILWQPGRATLASGSGTPTVAHVIASEVASIGGGPAAIVATPRFVDPARGDYRLRAASPAIDFAPPVTGDDRDAYGQPRDQRIDLVPRAPGLVRDIGALERQGLLPLVLNGEFDGDTNLWFLLPGHAGNYQVNNAPGSPVGGSAQVSGSGSGDRLLGHVQCIEIPGPGTYVLNGTARSEGDPALANDTALIWELRADGGEGCIDGPIVDGGVHDLSSRSTRDAFVRPPQGAIITVPESMWNHQTSVTVILAVYPNASNSGFNGLFDHVTLEPGSAMPRPDPLFADGYEDP